MAGPVSLSRKTSAVNIDGFLDLLVSLLCKEEGRTAVVRRDVRNYGMFNVHLSRTLSERT